MFKQKKCVPCQGGIPPLKGEEINSFLKLIDEDWETSLLLWCLLELLN